MTAARAPRYLAFGFMALFGLLGSLFVIGEVFTDPGGWTAVLLTAAWLVPAVALAVLAVRRPGTATRVLVPVATAVGAFTLADHTFDIVPRDDVGPVAAIAVFVTAVVVAFLGLHRALLAGVLLMALAAAQVVGILLGLAVHGADGRPIIGAALGGSSGVVVLPLLTAGLLFVVAGIAAEERLRHPATADHTDAPTPVS